MRKNVRTFCLDGFMALFGIENCKIICMEDYSYNVWSYIVIL